MYHSSPTRSSVSHYYSWLNLNNGSLAKVFSIIHKVLMLILSGTFIRCNILGFVKVLSGYRKGRVYIKVRVQETHGPKHSLNGHFTLKIKMKIGSKFEGSSWFLKLRRVLVWSVLLLQFFLKKNQPRRISIMWPQCWREFDITSATLHFFARPGPGLYRKLFGSNFFLSTNKVA